MKLTSPAELNGFWSAPVSEVQGFSASNIKRLEGIETIVLSAHGQRLPYYLARQHQFGNKSIEELEKELGIERRTIEHFFLYFGIPRLTASEASARNVELGIGFYGLSPEKVEEARQRGLSAIRAGNLNVTKVAPEVRRANASKAGKRSAELGAGVHGFSEEKRKKVSSNAGTVAREKKKGIFGTNDEGVRYCVLGGRASYDQKAGVHGLSHEKRSAISAEAGKIGGQAAYAARTTIFTYSPQRKHEIGVSGGKSSAAKHAGIHDPENRQKYLDTISGRRADVPYVAKSMWEANIYRMLRCLGFSITPDVTVTLNVDERRKNLFRGLTVDFNLDFSARSSKGNEYWLEIMAHPSEGADGIEKILMFREQFPDRKLIVVTSGKFDYDFGVSTRNYYTLEKAFSAMVNEMTVGWETYRNNLRTNPRTFAPNSS